MGFCFCYLRIGWFTIIMASLDVSLVAQLFIIVVIFTSSEIRLFTTWIILKKLPSMPKNAFHPFMSKFVNVME